MPATNSNPAFRNSPAFSTVPAVAKRLTTPTPEQLEEQFGRPSATPDDTGRMTYESTVVKTLIAFSVLIVGAGIGWIAPPGVWIVGALVGTVLAFVNIFKKKVSPPLILAYAGFEGIFVGGISRAYETLYAGIVPQAVFGSLAVIGVTLALFASGKVRASARATKIFLIAMLGYLAYSIVNVILVVTGVTHSMYGLDSQVKIFGIPLGLVIGVVLVLMAAYSLVLDFDSIQQGVRRGAPGVYAWQGAFGIMVTVVWLYLSILRIIGLARSN